MPLLQRLLGLLRRGLSTMAASPSQPPWAMIRTRMNLDRSAPRGRALLDLAAPPCVSHVVVRPDFLYIPPLTGPDSGTVRRVVGGVVSAASADGLLLVEFMDLRDTAPPVVVDEHGSDRTPEVAGFRVADIIRFVVNPLTGEVFPLPDIVGAEKTVPCVDTGTPTQSERPDQAPDRYAVAVLKLNDDKDGFVMRRFLSQTGKWDELALPSPSPSPHRLGPWMEVVAFAGRLWWVDISCGIVSADPFSDRPELHFVELPRGRVTEQPLEELDGFRRVGVSQGRLRYAEVSREGPFVLTSFTLDNDGSGWTMEHQVPFSRLWPGECHEGHPFQSSPRVGVFDPLNASVIHLTVDGTVQAVDMVQKKLLGCSVISGNVRRSSSFLKACVLPPWLGTTPIPSADTLSSNKGNMKSKTLSDVLVRVDRDVEN